MKASSGQYLPVVLFIMLYMVDLRVIFLSLWLKSLSMIIQMKTVPSCDTVYYAVQGGSTFWVCGQNPKGTK